MAWLDEEVSAQFSRWEERGRGWKLWPSPVELEPPFVPFQGYAPNMSQFADDGRRPNRITSALTKLGLFVSKPEAPPPPEEEPEPEPESLERSDLVELQLSLPRKLVARLGDMAPILRQLGQCREPIAFEILGTGERITVQFATAEFDAPTIRRQIKAHFPEIIIIENRDTLATTWCEAEDAERLVIEFGLGREFAYPLAKLDTDPFVGLLAALEELALGEAGLFQVLFQPVENPWADHLLRAVTDITGKPLFQNEPEITQLAQEKIASPLFAAVVRIAVLAEDFERALGIARDMAGSLRLFGRMDGNELIPLRNDEYPFEAHVEDVVLRQSHRSGMILNAGELTGFVHVPTADVHSAKLGRQAVKTKAAPKPASSGLLLGHNTHAGKTVEVRLSPDERSRHIHLLGASGSGKSTLLLNLIRQDIENGEGIAVLDPHGDLVDAVLGLVPERRMDDVVLLDPADETHSVGFNILSAHNELEKTLLASDLVAVFQRLSTSWGDQMNSVLQNAIMAFLESREGGTLTELRRFLIESDFRKQFLKTVEDSEVLYYWQKGFPQLSGNKSIGPILTRLDGFLAPKPIRHMVSQRENRLDFADIMDNGKIFLAKLSLGQMGKENAFLLGSLLVGKFQEIAMSRQAQAAASRRPFTLLVDEFQNFITPSMAEILTGVRKYRLGLILAHQDLRQLERDREVAGAVLGVHTRICFRLGDDDARKMADGFSSFDAHDLQNLNTGQAICRLERSDADFNLTVPLLESPDHDLAAQRREQATTRSREKYSILRSEVEAELRQRLALKTESDQPPKAETKKKADAPVVSKPEPPPEEPSAPEAPKPTPPPEPPVPVAATPKSPSETPRDMGRGGAQHKAVQKRLKEAAESLGFRSVIEKPVLDGQGSVDLYLERAHQNIACEISFTTTIDHEVKNVIKCLKAGLPKVTIICVDKERLRKIAEAVAGSLGSEMAARVEYFEPDPFIAHLKSLPVPAPNDSVNMHHGYKVKRSVAKLTLEELAQRENLANQVIAEVVKSKRAKSTSKKIQ